MQMRMFSGRIRMPMQMFLVRMRIRLFTLVAFDCLVIMFTIVHILLCSPACRVLVIIRVLILDRHNK